MGVLRESPWYQEILREGEARGEAQGLITSIEMNLDAKFGTKGLELMPRIQKIRDVEQLKGILRIVITANTIDDLQQIDS